MGKLLNRRKKPNSLPPADASASAKPAKEKLWRPIDRDGHPRALPCDFGLDDLVALAILEVRKDEWIGVYRGGSPPFGELLYESQSPIDLWRELKQLTDLELKQLTDLGRLPVRLARTKEELYQPMDVFRRPHDWHKELRRVVRNMTDGSGVLRFGYAWDAVRQLAHTDDALEQEKRIKNLWRMYPKAAEELDLPRLLESSPSRVVVGKKEPGSNAGGTTNAVAGASAHSGEKLNIGGRPRKDNEREMVREKRKAGKPWKQVADEMGAETGNVRTVRAYQYLLSTESSSPKTK